MNISEKLALQFIKKHFDKFDTSSEKTANALNSIDIVDFMRLRDGSRVFVYFGHALCVRLPKCLLPFSSSKMRMLRKVRNEHISFDVDYEANSDWYLVTQNRLDVLEEIMHNSGFDEVDVKFFKKEDIVKQDTHGNELETVAQNLLTLLTVYKSGDNFYFNADEVKNLCKNVDATYSDMLAKKDKRLCKIDPKSIECSIRLLELKQSVLTTTIESLNSLFERLSTLLTQK